MTRILITGASGFIGSHLTRALLARGHEVTALLRHGSRTARLADIIDRLRVVRLDLSYADALTQAVTAAQPETVYHLAMQTRFEGGDVEALDTALRANLTPLQSLLAACAALPTPPETFLRIGTIAEYGSAPAPYHETLREAPNSPYGLSALAGTYFLHAARPKLPFAAGTARLALTYGAGQSQDFLLPQLIASCQNRTPLALHRPDDRRDMIHVADVVTALTRLADLGPDLPGLINIGTGRAPTMRALARLVATAAGSDPNLFTFAHQPADTVSALRVDPHLMTHCLNWSPEIPLEQGVADLVAPPTLLGGTPLSPDERRTA